jgi:hypothetical protein
MRLWALIVVLILGLTGSSCATIPPEAVELSKTLGQMISKAKAAHIGMVDQHFDNLALQVDKFAMGEYKQAFMDNVRKIMKQRDPNFTDLTSAQYDAAMNRIMTARMGWLKTVWANKQTVLKSLEDYYALMEQANAELTNLIRSAAGVENTRNKLINDFTSQFGIQSKDLENKLMGSVTDVNNMLNGALQKVFGE